MTTEKQPEEEYKLLTSLKCHSCGSTASPDNPVMWWGIPTYCKPCYERIVAEGRWKGLQHYDRTGEEYPK